MLVLDDPLSALDVDTEALVEAALRRVLASTTALIVAHRPSTVTLADRVALMQDGRITAVGTHSELLASNDHYRFVISSLDDQAQSPSPQPAATESPLMSSQSSVTGTRARSATTSRAPRAGRSGRARIRLLGSLLRP